MTDSFDDSSDIDCSLSDNAELLVIAGFEEHIAKEIDTFENKKNPFRAFSKLRMSFIRPEVLKYFEYCDENDFKKVLNIIGFNKKLQKILSERGVPVPPMGHSLLSWLDNYIYCMMLEIDGNDDEWCFDSESENESEYD